MKFRALILAMFAATSLTGCVDYFEDNHSVMYPPVYPKQTKAPRNHNGSIYKPGYEMTLYQDRTAYHVGDILIVKLEEKTDGKKSAKTKTDKISSNETSAEEVFGANLKNGLGLKTDTNLKFDGTGESNQNNSLTGTISVTVTDVLPNGNLIVEGESWVTINTGREYIQLSGVIRTIDVAPDNTVSSKRIANARIRYSGNGMPANATRGGVITQFLTKYWPY